VYSPGGLTGNNNDAAFGTFMQNLHTHANYYYGQAEIRRETRLPGKFSWMLRGMGQIADSTLIASEMFGVGGYSTVRGYDERTATGDKGWLVQNEIRTPQFAVGNLTHKKNAKDWIQGLVFCDYGGIIQQNPTPGQSPNDQLLSVGAGLRCQVADNVHFRFDYGHQLKRSYLSDPGNLTKQNQDQFHFGVEISY
jgi:hemolysin activation/secretion protein